MDESIKCTNQFRFLRLARISHYYHSKQRYIRRITQAQRDRKGKGKDSKMEIVKSFPADPSNVCAVPITKKQTTLANPQNIDKPRP
jgi:hypothetical protein